MRDVWTCHAFENNFPMNIFKFMRVDNKVMMNSPSNIF